MSLIFSCRVSKHLSTINNVGRRFFSSPISDTSNFNNYVNASNFVTDENGHLKREQLFEKEVLGKILTYEKAKQEDFQTVIDFYVTHFNLNEVLTGTLGLSKEEAAELYTGIASDSENFMLREENKFIGMISAKKIQMNEFPKEKAALIRDDYGKLIDAGPFKHRKNNVISALLESCEAKTYDRMSFPCTFYNYEMIGIHPKFFGQGIGNMMNEAAFKYSKHQHGAKYCIGIPTSEASLKLHLKLPGASIAGKLPYVDFLDHGKKPFENAIGGNKFAYSLIWDLKEY